MTWLRRNRWGLILLPVALALAIAASSSRVVHFWWPYGPNEVSSGAVGEKVNLTQDWQDRSGKYVREVDVTVVSVEPTTVVRDWDNGDMEAKGPAGTKIWRVSLAFEAPTDTVIWGCQLQVIDDQGREFPYNTTAIKPNRMKTSPCLNSDETGPEPALTTGEKHKTEHPRPASWETVADVITAGDAVPSKVRIWWEYPKVIEIDVPRATSQ